MMTELFISLVSLNKNPEVNWTLTPKESATVGLVFGYLLPLHSKGFHRVQNDIFTNTGEVLQK